MTTKMIAMPSMPSMKKIKASRPCACGCGQATKSTWASGHDGRATGWAVRVERGAMTLDEVPENERAGAIIMLTRRGTMPAPPIESTEPTDATVTGALIAALTDAINGDIIDAE